MNWYIFKGSCKLLHNFINLQSRGDQASSPKSEQKSSLELINEIEVLKRRIRELEEANNKCRLQTIPGGQEQQESDQEKRILELERELSRQQLQPNEHSQNRFNDSSADMEAKLSQLTQQKQELEIELDEAKQQLSSNMLASIRVDSLENIRQLQEENRILRDQLTRSMNSLISNGKVSVNSVERGEVVLVVWSAPHSHYSIYHEGRVLHFLHSDSLEALGLSGQNSEQNPAKLQTTAEVVSKEFCQARKSPNRFSVAQGTRFYRVSCKPVDKSDIFTK